MLAGSAVPFTSHIKAIGYPAATQPVTVQLWLRPRLAAAERYATAVNAGRYALRANDRPITLPRSLVGSVLGVSGLDNASPTVPLIRLNSAHSRDCSRFYGQRKISGLPEAFGTTTFPTNVCGYSAGQLGAAYGASDAATGKGETIALVELGLARDMFLNLRDYAAANHMPAAYADAEIAILDGASGHPQAPGWPWESCPSPRDDHPSTRR